MGQISAEARGLVRVALQQVEVGIGDSLPQRLSAALEKRVERLQLGKRLTEQQVKGIQAEALRLTSHHSEFLGWQVYGQSRKLVLDGVDPFTEQLLEVRAMRLQCTRRRVRYDDHPMGLQVTFHALARVVERRAIRHDLIPFIVASAPDLSAYFLTLRLGLQADLTFAVPFAGGLAFGEYTNQDQLLGTVVYEADAEGSGFSVIDEMTPLQLAGQHRIGARISSYLAEEDLTVRQSALLTSWRELRLKHADAWNFLLQTAVTAAPTRIQTLPIQSLGIDVKKLCESELWTEVVRPSHAFLAQRPK